MDEQTATMLLTFGIIAVIFVGVGVFILVLMPKGKLAETQAEEGEPFLLRFVVPSRPPKLWIRYQVTYTSTSRHGHPFGLMLDLELQAEGQPKQTLKLSKGGRAPVDYEDAQHTELFVQRRSGPGGGSKSASSKLIELEGWEPGSELVIRGQASTEEETDLLGLKVYVAK